MKRVEFTLADVEYDYMQSIFLCFADRASRYNLSN